MTEEHKSNSDKVNGKVITETQRYDRTYSRNTETRDITHATTHIERDLSLTAAISNHGDILLQIRRGDVEIGGYEWHDSSRGVLTPMFSQPIKLDPNNDKDKLQAAQIGALLRAHLTQLPNEEQAQLKPEEARELLGLLQSDPFGKKPEAPDNLRGRTS